jgi:hypothetical protein
MLPNVLLSATAKGFQETDGEGSPREAYREIKVIKAQMVLWYLHGVTGMSLYL